jgi:hypothetical protein
VNVWSLRINTGGDLGTAVPAALTELRAFYNAIIGMWAPGTKINLGQITDRETQERVPGTWAEMTGTAVSSAAAPVLAVCVSWQTSLAARRGMGRTFIGPLQGEIVQDDGTVEPGTLDGIRTAAQDLVDASGGLNDWAFGVYGLQSKAPAGTQDYSSLPHVHRDFTGMKVRDQFAVLRSRRD